MSLKRQISVAGVWLARSRLWALEAHVEKAANLFSMFIFRKGCRHWCGGYMLSRKITNLLSRK